MPEELTSSHIGARIKEYRTRLNLSQKQLAERMGISAFQIISEIEAGRRELKARELFQAASALMTSVQNLLSFDAPAFAEPRWRDKPDTGYEEVEARLCLRCERYTLLEAWCDEQITRDLPSASLPKEHEPTFADLERAADDIRAAMKLGGRPAVSFTETLEEDYGIRIFYDTIPGPALSVSGKFGRAILLNRDDVRWRRNFSLAHELFHLLAEGVYQDPEKEERHAQSFAAALLLPGSFVASLLESKGHNGKIPVAELVAAAQEFQVSTEALLWRLFTMNKLTREQVKTLIASETVRALELQGRRPNDKPDVLPDRYVRLAYRAYNNGKIGLAKLAQFLETTAGELAANSKIWSTEADVDEEAEVALA
jgi:Zn-dependent peptidase ImmA (M78 family)/DNA-binding XRE family transcriptional regulator